MKATTTAHARGLRAVLSLLLTLSILLTGCWDSRDPKAEDIVIGVGFDRDPRSGDLLAIAQIATEDFMSRSKSFGGSPSGPSTLLVQGTGKDVPLAVQALGFATGKDLFWGQLRMFFFSSTLAREGVGPVIDQIIRNPSLRNGVPAVVIDGPLEPALAAKPVDGGLIALQALDHVQAANRNRVFSVRIWNYFATEHTPGWAPVLPLMRLEQQPGGANLRPIGMALFRNDKMVGKLTGDEATGLLILRNRFRRGLLNIPTSTGDALLENVLAQTVFYLDRWEGPTPVFAVRIHISGRIQDPPQHEVILRRQDITQIERATAQHVVDVVAASVRSQQAVAADATGFGVWLRYHDPQAFQRLQPWTQAFPRIRVEFTAVATLRYKGWRT